MVCRVLNSSARLLQKTMSTEPPYLFNEGYQNWAIQAYDKNFINTWVIVLSNEPEPIICGIITGWTEISQAGQKAPVVKPTNKPEIIVLGHIIPYSDRVWEMIKDMNSKQAWILFSAIRLMFEKVRRMHGD